MKKILLLGAAGLLFTSCSADAGAPAKLLDVRQFVGIIEYKTDNKTPLKVEVVAGKKLSANVRAISNGYTVSTNIGKITDISCRGSGGGQDVKINGVYYKYDDLPKIIATGSSSDGLRIVESQVVAKIGDIGGVTINSVGCGDIVIGNVKHSLELSNSGSADFTVGNIGGSAIVKSVGAGDVKIGNVKSDLNLILNGSGDAKIGHIGGITNITSTGAGDIDLESAKSLFLTSNGAGDVEIKSGKGKINATLSGAGDLTYGGIAVDPQIESFGVGEIKLNKTEGAGNYQKR